MVNGYLILVLASIGFGVVLGVFLERGGEDVEELEPLVPEDEESFFD